MRRIREQFRDNAFDQERFDLEEEKKFVHDIIKKKEEQGLFADGFLSSNQRTNKEIFENVR